MYSSIYFQYFIMSLLSYIESIVLSFAYIHGMRPIKIELKLFFLYVTLHIIYRSGILYPLFMTNALISVLQVY